MLLSTNFVARTFFPLDSNTLYMKVLIQLQDFWHIYVFKCAMLVCVFFFLGIAWLALMN